MTTPTLQQQIDACEYAAHMETSSITGWTSTHGERIRAAAATLRDYERMAERVKWLERSVAQYQEAP